MKFLRRIFAFLKMFLGSVAREIRDNVENAIFFVQIVKKVVDNPALDLITGLTATPVDNRVLAKLRKALPKVIAGLVVVDGLKGKKEREAFALIIEAIRALHPNLRNAVYLKIASQLAQMLSGDLKESEADTLTQIVYAELKHDNRLPETITIPENVTVGDGEAVAE